MTARALRRFPRVAQRGAAAVRAVGPLRVAPEDLDARLAAAREGIESVDLFLAPSRSIAAEFIKLGIAPSKIKVSDYGFAPLLSGGRPHYHGPLRIGYVGTLDLAQRGPYPCRRGTSPDARVVPVENLW